MSKDAKMDLQRQYENGVWYDEDEPERFIAMAAEHHGISQDEIRQQLESGATGKRPGRGREIRYKLIMDRNERGRRLRYLALKALSGPGDDAEPVITIMLPGQD